MNTKHPNIHFTYEMEDQNSFSFLDKKLSEILRKKLLKHQFIEKGTILVKLTGKRSLGTLFT